MNFFEKIGFGKPKSKEEQSKNGGVENKPTSPTTKRDWDNPTEDQKELDRLEAEIRR